MTINATENKDLGFELYLACGTLVDTLMAKWRSDGVSPKDAHHAVMKAYLSLITVYIGSIGEGEIGRNALVEIYMESVLHWLDEHNALMRQAQNSTAH